MVNITKELMEFINGTPTAYNCIENIKETLKYYGYQELYEHESWNLDSRAKCYVVRGDSSIIAFSVPSRVPSTGFNITAVHTDSPCFSIKKNPEIVKGNYEQLNIEGYGGMINHTWLDRPLSIAGRVICKDSEDRIFSKTININKDLLIIPSQAIHINREVNQKQSLNKQIDMIPVLSASNAKNLHCDSLKTLILKEIKDSSLQLLDYDLYLYNRDQSKILGMENELLVAPRLDDLACLYPSFRSFVDSENKYATNVFCALNNEEIGNSTKQGANSNFLLDILTRIANNYSFDLFRILDTSFIISADNAHAIHPNAPGKSDPTNQVNLNQGIVIKHHSNYTTDGISSALFKEICKYSDIPYQDFCCRSDMICGRTLGGISTSHVGINSIDIGLAQLAMHSATETMGSHDPEYLYGALREFYESRIEKEKNAIKLKRR